MEGCWWGEYHVIQLILTMTVVQVVLPKKGKGPAAAPTSSKDPVDQGLNGTPDSTTLAHEKCTSTGSNPTTRAQDASSGQPSDTTATTNGPELPEQGVSPFDHV